MASEAQMNQLQSLYIAYFGRPADAAGVTYWTPIIDGDTSFDEIAGRFMDSDEFTATSSDLNDVVTAAYANGLGREAGADEVAFWVGQIEAGNETVASLLEAFRSTDDATDSQTLENKITVANAYTDAAVAGANFDTAASVALLAGVDATQASVDAALGEIGAEVPVDTAELNELLGAIQTAQAEETAFLAEAAKNEAVGEVIAATAVDATKPTNDEIKTAIDTVVNGARVALNGELALGASINAATTERSELAIIADSKEALEKDVSDAQEAVSEVRGLTARIDAVQARSSQYEAALKNQADAEGAYDDQVAIVEALNSGVTLTGTFGTTDISDATGVILAIQSNGTYALGDAAKAAGFKGAADLLAAANAQVAADAALATADTNLTTAVNRVLEIEYAEQDAGTFSAYADVDALATASIVTVTTGEVSVDFSADTNLTGSISQDLLEAKVALADFNTALQAYQAIRAIEGEAAALETAVTDAFEALEDAGYEVQAIDGGVAGTLEDDVFLFQQDTVATDLVVTGFGDEGQDAIYFGEGFTLVGLGEQAITDRVGSATEMEIFWKQEGADLVLYVESTAESGRDLNAAGITTITLTGVSADSVDLAAGFLLAGEVAA